MKLLVTGGSGLVGSHFIENFNGSRENFTVLSPDQDELDITNQGSVKNFFRLHKPDAVIHFAAFTDVSAAERQRGDKNGTAWRINVLGTANLTEESQGYFIYISTDTVFSGAENNPGPYPEDCPTGENPNLVSWYGWTKKEAEKIVMNNLRDAAVLRISNPVRARYRDKTDYVRKILSLFDTGKLYPMFNDQYLTLTYINEVTETLKLLLEKKPAGVFHASSVNVFTPHKLANLLIEKARGVKNAVPPVSIAQFLKDNPARYPQYGGLLVEKTQKQLNLKFMRWEEIIGILAKQLSV